MGQEANVVRRGVYNVEYFSGAQVSLYIGDVWVDEVTTLAYGYTQSRSPIYGYASTLFDDVSEGHILVTGTFTVNFKEAGYLWLILDRYRKLHRNKTSLTARTQGPFDNVKDVGGRPGDAERQNIEQIVNGETSVFERNQFLLDLARRQQEGDQQARIEEDFRDFFAANSLGANLGGFASTQRFRAATDPEERSVGRAENRFEAFENALWRKSPAQLDQEDRRADDNRLNPFDLYVTFGDFAGDDYANHTIERIRNVYILGKSKQIQIDGLPIQEQYTFIARTLI